MAEHSLDRLAISIKFVQILASQWPNVIIIPELYTVTL